MGLDLKLLPFRVCDNCSQSALTVINAHLFSDDILAISSLEMPRGFYSHMGDNPVVYGEHAYGETTLDAYGNPLRSVSAGDLALFFDSLFPEEHPSFNVAAFAYVKAMLPEDRVALYWN